MKNRQFLNLIPTFTEQCNKFRKEFKERFFLENNFKYKDYIKYSADFDWDLAAILFLNNSQQQAYGSYLYEDFQYLIKKQSIFWNNYNSLCYDYLKIYEKKS